MSSGHTVFLPSLLLISCNDEVMFLLLIFIPQSINQDSQHSNASISSTGSDKDLEVYKKSCNHLSSDCQ